MKDFKQFQLDKKELNAISGGKYVRPQVLTWGNPPIIQQAVGTPGTSSGQNKVLKGFSQVAGLRYLTSISLTSFPNSTMPSTITPLPVFQVSSSLGF